MGDIFKAIEKGNLPRIRELLQDPQFDLSQTTYRGRCPLSFACQISEPAAVELLLKDPRVNVDMEVDQFGRMPLSELRYIGDLPCLKWLMALRGSQLNWELKGDDEPSSIGAVRERAL